MADPLDPDGPVPDGAVTVYWRPGCMFCVSLRRGLDRAGLRYGTRNIWEDEDAAAFVRSVTGGDETVPTVAVGGLALVNPTSGEVLSAVAEEAPDLVPDDWEPPEPGVLARIADRLFG